MIGLDTNVLVRYIVQDDAAQAAAASRLIEARCTPDDPGFVSVVVLAELCWVLQRGYGYSRKVIADVLGRILGIVELRVEQPQVVWRAFQAFRGGHADFPDYLIATAGTAAGCEATWTFDRKAAKSPLHQLLEA